MNRNRIFAIFILMAVLVTCAGVSFASSDFDNAYVDDSDLDDYIPDELDDSLEDDVGDDSDLDDYIPDELDEDFDDDLDDDYDDEDWDEDFDDIAWHDDYDYYWDGDDNVTHMEKTSFVCKGIYYEYELTFYASGKALGYAYAGPVDDEYGDNETDCDNSTNDDEKSPAGCTMPKGSDSQNLLSCSYSQAKSIDLANLKDGLSSLESQTNKTGNKTIDHINIQHSDYGDNFLAILAMLILCLVVIL